MYCKLFWTWPCTTFNIILVSHNLWTKKVSCTVRESPKFRLWCLPAFITSSPLLTMVWAYHRCNSALLSNTNRTPLSDWSESFILSVFSGLGECSSFVVWPFATSRFVCRVYATTKVRGKFVYFYYALEWVLGGFSKVNATFIKDLNALARIVCYGLLATTSFPWFSLIQPYLALREPIRRGPWEWKCIGLCRTCWKRFPVLCLPLCHWSSGQVGF